jgi:hypothetical protein
LIARKNGDGDHKKWTSPQLPLFIYIIYIYIYLFLNKGGKGWRKWLVTRVGVATGALSSRPRKRGVPGRASSFFLYYNYYHNKNEKAAQKPRKNGLAAGDKREKNYEELRRRDRPS